MITMLSGEVKENLSYIHQAIKYQNDLIDEQGNKEDISNHKMILNELKDHYIRIVIEGMLVLLH